MTITVSEKWKNPDSTQDLNKPVKNLVEKGFVWGGAVAPTGIGLSVTIAPFAAFTADGMVGVSDAIETFPVVAGQTSVVVFLAKYNFGGSPAVPVANIQVLELSVYNLHVDKAYMNELCRIVLPGGAVTVVAGDIDFTQRDEVDSVGRSSFRGIVTFANLPVPASPTNRVGDHYWVSDHQVTYFWDGATWQAQNTGSFNAETNLLNDQLETRQRNRLGGGSGIVAGTRPGDGSFAAYPEITPIETPAVANSIDLDAFSAVINGHFVETYARSVLLAAAADRLDLIFLEIWREDIVTPNNLLYGLNPTGAATVNIEGVDDIEETLTWLPGLAGNNYDFYKVEVYNHAWRVIKVRFAYLSNCPVIALVDPVDTTVATAATNIDGNSFVAPTGTQSDDRIWKAVSTTGVDGWSWAIPLFVIKRTVAENPGINDAIKIFRNGERHVFPVYPVADLDVAAKSAIDTIDKNEPVSPLDPTKVTYEKPSGFLTSVDFGVQAGGGANTIKFYEDRVKVRIRGYEEWLSFASANISVGTAPVLGWERVLVVLTHKVTLYDNDPATKTNFTLGSHRPFLPSTIAGTIRGMGYKRGYLNYEVEIKNLGATNVLDEYDAMTAAGWTRGDLAAPAGYEYADGGLWSRVSATATYADPEGNPYGVEWAIPICLIHRRNSTTYNFDTNPNGSRSARPDDRTSQTVVYPDDLVSLKHRADLSLEELPAFLDEQIDLLHKGQLHTRMANKYLGAGVAGEVAGSRILQADIIGTTTGGPWPLTAGDSSRRIWSDGREYQLISVEFDILAGAPISTTQYNYTYAGSPPDQGTLVIKAPSGSFLIRHLPGFAYLDGDGTSPDFLQFYGPPCWSTQRNVPANTDAFPLALFATTPEPVKAKYIDGTLSESNLPFYVYGSTTVSSGEVEPFEVTATDTMGRATQMEGHVDTTGISGTAVLSWWVCYDRSFATLDNYDDNFGLAEIPDTVWKVTRDPGVTDVPVNVGAIYTNVQKVVVASATIVITAADVTAASGLPGTIRLVGLDHRKINWSPTVPTISSITLEDINQDDITINLSAPWTGTVEVIIYFETSTVDTWVEIGRGGKSVQSLFSWLEQDIDITAAPPAIYSQSLGSTSFVAAQIGGEIERSTPIFWSRAGVAPGTRWVLSLVVYSGYAYSNLLSFDTTFLSRYVKAVVCGLKALGSAPADRLVIEYTYTPYQGQSTPSGLTPNPAVALPLLKSMLHGSLEQVSDWYASQSGPASFHSGIETWSGVPINQVHPSYQANYMMPLSRFAAYNRTALVAPKPLSGFSDRTGLYQQFGSYNAASLLRLPFPQNPAMVTSFSWYHNGVMEFDFDPCRAGAGAGVLSYAPGYWGDVCNHPDFIRYDQFDNGLTPFSVRGGVVERADNLILLPDEYNTLGSTTVAQVLAGNWLYFTQGGGADYLNVFTNLHVETGSLIKRVQHHIEVEVEPGSGTDVGMRIYLSDTRGFLSAAANNLGYWLVDNNGGDMSASCIAGFTATVLTKYIMSIHPGAIHNHQMLSQGFLACQATLRNRGLPTNGQITSMFHTSVLAEEHYTRDHTRSSADYLALALQSGLVDIVKIPWSSHSSTSVNTNRQQSISGSQNLRGTTVPVIAYPSGWAAGDITALEALFHGGQDSHNRGRGLYLGSSLVRYTMPVLLPGSGSSLRDITYLEEISLTQAAEDVPQFPVRPGEPLFGENNRTFMEFSHGGPIAYVYSGMFVNPSSDEHLNQLVLQISGGPVSFSRSIHAPRQQGDHSVYDVDGTAIDAFWPTGRPLVASKR